MLKSKSLWACFILMILLLQGSAVTIYAKPISGYSNAAEQSYVSAANNVSVSKNASVANNVSVASDVFASNDASVTDDTSLPSNTSAVNHTSAIDNVSASNNTSTISNISSTNDTSVADNTSTAENLSTANHTSVTNHASVTENTSTTGNLLATSTASAINDTSATNDTPASKEEIQTPQEAKPANSQPKSLGTFRTTGYCPCSRCSGKWGKRTSTGAIPQSGHTVAVDPRVIPYGTKLMINGTVYTAEDCGGGVKGKHIDIYYDTHSQATRHGSRSAEVFLVPIQ